MKTNHWPGRALRAAAIVLSVWAAGAWAAAPAPAGPGAAPPADRPAEIRLNGQPAPPASLSACGFRVVADQAGPQLALMDAADIYVADLQAGEEVVVALPLPAAQGAVAVWTEVRLISGQAQASLDLGDGPASNPALIAGQPAQFHVQSASLPAGRAARLTLRAPGGAAVVRWSALRIAVGDEAARPGAAGKLLAIQPKSWPDNEFPSPRLPALRAGIEQALIEWDWRMQDGIRTPKNPSTYASAIDQTFRRGDLLLADLRSAGADLGDLPARWETLRAEWKSVWAAPAAGSAQIQARPTDAAFEPLWLQVHRLRRAIALANPLARLGPLAFVKQVPGAFSHQLTQVYGRYARPGGGVFVLDEPGKSMACRQLAAGKLGEGSYQTLDVSYDGRRVLAAYCDAPTSPRDGIQGHRGRYYHLYELTPEGASAGWAGPAAIRQLTSGDFDDFSPRHLPNGQIVFISTRRLGWHRCGSPGCENYTLALAEADGSRPRPISYHETQEWDPAVLADGRIIYTRWDYVDRHAVYYEQLWTVRPDGSAPAAFYGNNTFNPVGVWEPRAVPGSTRVIATAAAHHAMTAGSIILLDTARGVDGPPPITRLTGDALFPESETTVLPAWRGAAGAEPIASPPEQLRWPGHCYRSPCPLSERYFLAAYSFDPLVGEPKANAANMFGLYLVDAAGNKELLYRDLNIASLWPAPLRPRPRPPILSPPPALAAGQTGLYVLQDVYAADPALPPETIHALRVVQVLPKSTPGINNPPVGLPNASPGKQVLGTVPVEADGSAFFEAPAGIALSFQALDDRGQAVQVMRSITYLQPGETAACVGCHEPRTSAPPRRPAAATPMALRRSASRIRPAPDGSAPLSFPILVQGVLDKHCVRCHSGPQPKAGMDLTGRPEGHYTFAYNSLAKRVPFSAWGVPGDFRRSNSEPLSTPNFFGARGGKVMRMLLAGHNKVALTAEEIDRLTTWMDANALFYGTFDRADQARQQAGQRIEGPKLQ